jgi:hypothetical protein
MIGVEVTPAKPFLSSHTSEIGMRDRRVIGPVVKSPRQRKQFGTVGLKLHWSRTSNSLLHLRGCRSALRPFRRHPQGNPLNGRSLEKSRRWTGVPFAERHPKGIAKVTNHLVCRHFPPNPAVGRSDRGHASNNRLPIGGGIKRSHKPWPPGYKWKIALSPTRIATPRKTSTAMPTPGSRFTSGIRSDAAT